MNPRTIGYSIVLTIMVTIFIFLMSMRSSLETTILRERGTVYQELPGNVYSNIYEMKVINKTFDPIKYEIKLVEPQGEIVSLGIVQEVEGQSLAEGRFMVKLNGDELTGFRTELTFAVLSNGEEIERVKTGFLGPANN